MQRLYEDSHLWVYNKPPNIALLADRKHEDNLWRQLKARKQKPYLVHRLDKGTSGVLLVAKDQATQRTLTQAFQRRHVAKYYLTRVVGHFPAGQTYVLDLPLCKGRKSRYRIAGERNSIKLNGQRYHVIQDREGVEAVTRVRCLTNSAHHSVLLVKPLTGRSHQIRVHLSWLGFPIVGDHLYGQPHSPLQQAERLLLHCHRLVVPGLGAFVAPNPDFSVGDDANHAPNGD